ncbi:hypothetical protein X778_13615 [Pseudomonas aeruginosa VRFPA07]|nr:hypothetical protein X778_13615 [Pseudomonas aeruginosa VRFPA07]
MTGKPYCQRPMPWVSVISHRLPEISTGQTTPPYSHHAITTDGGLMAAKSFKQMIKDGDLKRADAMKARLEDPQPRSKRYTSLPASPCR